MTPFTIVTFIVCLVGVQINAHWIRPVQRDLYAESTNYAPQRYGSSSGYGLSGQSSSYNKGGIGGFSSIGKLQPYGKSSKAIGYAGNKVTIPAGYGSKGFGAATYKSKKGGFGSSILGSTHGSANGISNGCDCGSNQMGPGYGGYDNKGPYRSAAGTQNVGSSNPVDNTENVASPYPTDGVENVGSPNDIDETEEVGSPNSSADAEDVGSPNSSADEEDVGSPYPGSFIPHHFHGFHGPSPIFPYPPPPSPVKCGNNLLISCNPSSQVVPCSSHSVPSYGSPY